MAGKDGMNGVSRREALLVGGAGLLTGGGATSLAQGNAPGKPAPGKKNIVTVEDATNVALTVSPDGKMVAMDLLGILWTIPIDGGTAKRLTGDFDDLGQPDFSPDGRRIVFQSYRTGNFHIWSIPAAGGALLQHSFGDCDDREPRWSPDGKRIAFASDHAQGRFSPARSGSCRSTPRGCSPVRPSRSPRTSATRQAGAAIPKRSSIWTMAPSS